MIMSADIQKNRVLDDVLPLPDQRKLVLLTGARQTGKTTLARLKYPELKYINLDAPENREILREVPTASWGKDIGKAIIDEAQKEPIVFEKVKYAFDDRLISFEVLLGSSQILLIKKIRESLAGRISIYELWPLLMCELNWDMPADEYRFPLIDRLFGDEELELIFRNIPGILIHNDAVLGKEAEDYILKWGGMPALLPLLDNERWKWLKDYEYTYLERDLADLARLDDLSPFRKFQKISALRSGMLLNYSKLARDASVSVDMARRYLEYLRISYQVILLQPYYENITSSVVKTPKLYWLDIGLLRQLSGFYGELTGQIYETMVVGELIKWIRTLQKTAEVYFYRTRSGLELDILLKTRAGIIGIEIKSRNKVYRSDTRAMREVAFGLKEKWRGGLVVYRGDEIKKIAEPNIWAIPSYRLFA